MHLPSVSLRKNNHFISLLSSFQRTAQDGEYERTAGIDISQIHLPEVGEFSIWDCAGQKEFHITHSMFLEAENAIFAVIYDLSKVSDNNQSQREEVNKVCN